MEESRVQRNKRKKVEANEDQCTKRSAILTSIVDIVRIIDFIISLFKP